MAPRVVIIDYHLGNIHSVARACAHSGLDAVVSSDYRLVRDAHGIVLPGVGAFGDAMSNIGSLKLDQAILDSVAAEKPFLGICLGMQLLFDTSYEFGVHNGLGIFKGTVRPIPRDMLTPRRIKVPHVGWSAIEPNTPSAWQETLLSPVAPGQLMYFVHSYVAEPANPNEVLSWTTYGHLRFCSSVRRGKIFASQFHPEKSGPPGLSIYSQWAALVTEESLK